MTDCHQKGKEVGLWYEVECLERDLKSPRITAERRKFLKGLLKSYKEELSKRLNHSS